MSPFLHPRVDRFLQYSTDSSDYLLTPSIEDGDSVESQGPQSAKFKEKRNHRSSSLSYEGDICARFLQVWTIISRWSLRRKGVCLVLIAVILVGLGTYKMHSQTATRVPEDSSPSPFERVSDEWAESAPWTEAVLIGPPSSTFRENLRNDTQYITAWADAGWTNDVMTYMNMIYLAVITSRVPIIPPFQPTHVGIDAGHLPFSAVFDIPRLSRSLTARVPQGDDTVGSTSSGSNDIRGTFPIIEWWQVKDLDVDGQDDKIGSVEGWDDLGCWSVWAESNTVDHRPRYNRVEPVLRLDTTYTPIPFEARLEPESRGDWHTTYWGIGALGFKKIRTQTLSKHFPDYPSLKIEGKNHVIEQNGYDELSGSRKFEGYYSVSESKAIWPPVRPHTQTSTAGLVLAPSHQLLCYDFLYFLSSHKGFEFEYDYSPAWRFVGRYVRWTQQIENLAWAYLRDLWNVREDEEVPPFIAVHVRHTDFKGWCAKDLPLAECFAPLDAYARRVREIEGELKAKWRNSGVNGSLESEDTPIRVLVTSDDTSEEFWNTVRSQGTHWTWIDHDQERTAETVLERLGWSQPEGDMRETAFRSYGEKWKLPQAQFATTGKWFPAVLDAVFQSFSSGFVGTDRSTMSLIAARRVQDWNDGPVRLVRWGTKDADSH